MTKILRGGHFYCQPLTHLTTDFCCGAKISAVAQTGPGLSALLYSGIHFARFKVDSFLDLANFAIFNALNVSPLNCTRLIRGGCIPVYVSLY